MKTRSITLQEITKAIPDCRLIGDENATVSDVISFKDIAGQERKNCISWISDKNAPAFSGNLVLGLLIVSETSLPFVQNSGTNFLVSDNPRRTFRNVLEAFFNPVRLATIEPTSFIHPESRIGKNCYIGRNVVIESGCIIGDNVEILHNTVIMEGTIIGNSVKIGCNCTIGNYGFGYEKDERGEYGVLPHIGNVEIHDHVEIGNNTCIDRAVMGSTVIRQNAKIDNQVHIAHGAVIGENSLIIAHAMIAGSAVIGKNCWVAPCASVLNGVTLADETYVGMGAVVTKSVTTPGLTLVGSPAIPIEDARKWSRIKEKWMETEGE